MSKERGGSELSLRTFLVWSGAEIEELENGSFVASKSFIEEDGVELHEVLLVEKETKIFYAWWESDDEQFGIDLLIENGDTLHSYSGTINSVPNLRSVDMLSNKFVTDLDYGSVYVFEVDTLNNESYFVFTPRDSNQFVEDMSTITKKYPGTSKLENLGYFELIWGS
ncbi:hypothetical protein [Parvicella tangerina]|uniref:Uncharacterized protein n=1 Tax=Parvicella tangerina TaxID=2829795 RepID=A0A916JMN2_9FLAO|nr:hypothetical protein [Parvicella tangerina]CAG5081132.1 hypothetical protein CRYO30217_01545 [Parvicella tangerina]